MRSTEPNDGGDAAAAHTGMLSPQDRARLLAIARASIEHGLGSGCAVPVQPEDESERLRADGAAFVTLQLAGALRGCIGHLEPIQPLVRDVAENAYAAAFRDPRFRPLAGDELAALRIQISVLTPAEPIAFASEQDLLAALEPGVDGVILSEDAADSQRRGTFLPSVWAQLPRPEAFLRHLKQKAGLNPNHWSEQMRAWRYRTESFGE